MNVYLPVMALSGLNSPLSRHFGSAPHFVIYDTERRALVSLDGAEPGHDDAICPCGTPGFPYAGIDAILCAGMGDRAWRQCASRGIAVYATRAATVREAVAMFQTGPRTMVAPHGCCLARRGPAARAPA